MFAWSTARIVILASVFGLCKPYSWKRVLGKIKNYNFSFAMCPNIDANLYAANFENTKASMAILAKKQDFTSLDIYN